MRKRAEIAQALTMLCAAYPNADGKDLSAFAFIAREDIARMGPSIYALTRGCQKLRRSCKFLPSIAEMVEAFKSVRSLDPLIFNVDRFPKLLIEAEEAFERRAAEAAARASITKGDKT